jgi:multidrug efflux pump subunit AcrB
MSHKHKNSAPGPIAWMARNSVTANLAMLVLLIGGIMTAVRIKKEVFPEFSLSMVNVSVSYSGASPEEVERGIVLAIEENIRGLEGVKKVTSRASEGRASITAELLEDADEQKVYQDIQQEVNSITTFPEDAETPTVALASHVREVLNVSLYGDVDPMVLREQAEALRDRFLLDENITQVELSGVSDYEIVVSVPRDNLSKYNLTLSDVATKIDALALELPGGGIKTDGGEILLRMKERRDYASQFANLPIITNNDGTVVTLDDIAEIKDAFDEDSNKFASWDGKPAVKIEIYRVGDQTPVSVATAARQLIEQFNEELPPNLNLVVVKDQSEVYSQRLELLSKNGLIGLILVLGVLSLFLEIKLAFWVMMGIPISFLGGLALLPFCGISINIMSMFAFLIALGIVVDDAIVIGENIHEHRQKGDSYLEAAIRGAREVAVPVTFSVLTNIVTFLPLMFLPGVIGKIWFVIPVVVNLVFFISLLECIFILPSHLGHGSSAESGFFLMRWIHNSQQAFSRFFMRSVRRFYGPFLEWCLRNRYIVVAAGMALLIVSVAYVNSRRIGMVPMISVEADSSVVTAVLPYGSPVAKTKAVRDRLVSAAQAVARERGIEELLGGVYAEVGKSYGGISGGHVLEVTAYLGTPEQREKLNISTTQFTDLWRQKTGDIAGLETILFEADHGGPGSGSSLSLALSHSNSETLDKACLELAEALGEFPIVSDIDDGVAAGKSQLDFSMLPEGVALGLTAEDVARQVRYAFYGAQAMRQQRGRNEVTVKVRLPQEERVSEADLDNFLIRTPSGVDVPLREVASFKRGRSYISIEHTNGQRTIGVTANVTPKSESENVLADVIAKVIPKLKDKYPGLAQSFDGRQEDLREGMSSLLMGFVIAVLGIYALLAIPFKSYTQPLIIMTCIPFGIVGALWAHVIMGYPLSLMSMMGIVALSGVVVNDSLVLIDCANGERQRGASAHDAMCTAGIRRFRPILLTTLTTFLGLAPMIFETSRQARFMIPMALSLGFGILFSTFITLVLVPALYMILEDLHDLLAAVFGHSKPQAEVVADVAEVG